MNARRRISAPKLRGQHCTGSEEYFDRAQTGHQNQCRSAQPLSQLGQNPKLPHCNSNGRFTSISGHAAASSRPRSGARCQRLGRAELPPPCDSKACAALKLLSFHPKIWGELRGPPHPARSALVLVHHRVRRSQAGHLPDTPLITDYAKTDEERQIFKVALARQVMAWPFAAPPGTPVERVAALRRAFDETLRDREYLAEAERLNLEITPVSGERIQSLIADVYQQPALRSARKLAQC
jgi:hypothetical protein